MEKRKIVFTDFLDTLVHRDIKYNNEKADKEYQTIQEFLNNYLNENNYMFILSALDHTSLDDFLEIFNKMSMGIDKGKIKNLFFYITGHYDTYKLVKDYKIRESGIVVNHCDCNKKVVVDHLVKSFSIGKDDTVMAAGDSARDINMLFSVHDIGGTSYYVDRYALPKSDEMEIKSIINSIACHSIEQPYLSSDWNEQYINIFNELADKYRNGIMSKDDLQKMYATYQIADVCDCAVSNESYYDMQKNIEKKLVFVRDCNDVLEQFKK